MIGAILGDIVGSVFEFDNHKSTEFEFLSEESVFTDDTVMTIATMDVLLSGDGYAETYKKWFRRYPDAGFGGMFFKWGFTNSLEPYNSWGNGSAMRVSPVGLWHDTLDQTRAAARASASATHNHPEGIKGAEAGSWYGLMAPKGIPEDVRARLVASATKALASAEVRDKIAGTGLDPVTLTGQEFQDYLHRQWDSLGRVIRSKQISLND